MSIRISVLVPAYNEQSTILTVLRRVNQVRMPGVEFEIIVIDDGSKDDTLSLLKSEPGLYTKLIALAKNQGKGAAVIAGLESAAGDYILFQDADLEYDPADYPKIINALIDYKADVVMGSRVLAPQVIRIHYGMNKLGNKILTMIFNLLYNKTFTDVYSCYLAYRRNLVDPKKLKIQGFAQHAEILCECVKNGRIFYEVAITYHGRDVSEGKKIKAHHVFGVIWAMLKCRLFEYRIRRPSRHV